MATSTRLNPEVKKKDEEWKWNLTIAIVIVSSVIIVFVDYLFPLTTSQTVYFWIFDLVSVLVLFVDYMKRLNGSNLC